MKEKIKKIGLIIFYFIVWLLFIWSLFWSLFWVLVALFDDSSIMSEREFFKQFFILVILPFLFSSYLLRRQLKLLISFLIKRRVEILFYISLFLVVLFFMISFKPKINETIPPPEQNFLELPIIPPPPPPEQNFLELQKEVTPSSQFPDIQVQKRISELEQKIVQLQQQLQQTQQFQSPTGYKSSEIVEYLGKYIVKVGCSDKYGRIMEGSGIIYGLDSENRTIILTNYHIIENADLTLEYPPCIVVYSSNPTKGFTDLYLANPIYYPGVVSLSTMRLIDFSFLRIEAKLRFSEHEGIEIIPRASLKITDHVPIICSKDKIKIGEEIVVLGYPTIGGEYLTATEGIISGFDGDYYFVTSAKIEKGNSGGGAFLKSTGCLAGMPTFVRLGEIESFARLINMSYLEQNYLSKIFK